MTRPDSNVDGSSMKPANEVVTSWQPIDAAPAVSREQQVEQTGEAIINFFEEILSNYPGESSDRTNTIRNVRSELSDALHAKNPRPEKVVADTRQNQNRVTDHPMPSES